MEYSFPHLKFITLHNDVHILTSTITKLGKPKEKECGTDSPNTEEGKIDWSQTNMGSNLDSDPY